MLTKTIAPTLDDSTSIISAFFKISELSLFELCIDQCPCHFELYLFNYQYTYPSLQTTRSGGDEKKQLFVTIIKSQTRSKLKIGNNIEPCENTVIS